MLHTGARLATGIVIALVLLVLFLFRFELPTIALEMAFFFAVVLFSFLSSVIINRFTLFILAAHSINEIGPRKRFLLLPIVGVLLAILLSLNQGIETFNRLFDLSTIEV